ncbi:MAG: hypothetical protein HRT44_08945 [Bdellovibrionales bacterium]|nr:hypothetical protein [Bdellovibrionales bacterium]NQZ19367.1 hypothetical protein [Bdellovibrionales bacterium]
MKKLFKILLTLFGVLVALVIGASFLLKPHFEEFQKKAESAQVKNVLMTVYTTAASQWVEDGVYPESLEAMGFSSDLYAITYSSDGKTFTASIIKDGIRYTVDEKGKRSEEPVQ